MPGERKLVAGVSIPLEFTPISLCTFDFRYITPNFLSLLTLQRGELSSKRERRRRAKSCGVYIQKIEERENEKRRRKERGGG